MLDKKPFLLQRPHKTRNREMNLYFYDVVDADAKDKVNTFSFLFPDEEEEKIQHSELRISLREVKTWPPEKLKEFFGVEKFEDFWTEKDQEVAFRKYKGDVLMFIECKFDPTLVKEVRNMSGEVIWRSERDLQ